MNLTLCLNSLPHNLSPPPDFTTKPCHLHHAADDFFQFAGHDDEALDGFADVLQTGSDGLQQFVEPAHLLNEHGVHALTVRRRVLEQRRRDVEV